MVALCLHIQTNTHTHILHNQQWKSGCYVSTQKISLKCYKIFSMGPMRQLSS